MIWIVMVFAISVQDLTFLLGSSVGGTDSTGSGLRFRFAMLWCRELVVVLW